MIVYLIPFQCSLFIPGTFFLNHPQQNHQSYPLNDDESKYPGPLDSYL
jgi:hypothetical protein